MSTPNYTAVRYRALCDRCSRPAWWRQHPSEPFPHCTCLCPDRDVHATTNTETP